MSFMSTVLIMNGSSQSRKGNFTFDESFLTLYIVCVNLLMFKIKFDGDFKNNVRLTAFVIISFSPELHFSQKYSSVRCSLFTKNLRQSSKLSALAKSKISWFCSRGS